MEFRVDVSERAARDLKLLFLAIRADESESAARWFNGMERAIESLAERPTCCPVAPESRSRRVIRQLLYGRKPHIYRVLFQTDSKNRTVRVLHIRHGARRPGRLPLQ
ncbi:MAG: type II toxin-antitoxin system RelE/ParE family toxin [Acidobacteriia bacterium]|nr:type II toxin-antitoxin system RelE/ParE family toxin [Terriglobia bacterium]